MLGVDERRENQATGQEKAQARTYREIDSRRDMGKNRGVLYSFSAIASPGSSSGSSSSPAARYAG
jgi:hypothetical protein